MSPFYLSVWVSRKLQFIQNLCEMITFDVNSLPLNKNVDFLFLLSVSSALLVLSRMFDALR